VLGAGPAQRGALLAARRLGVETVACDRDADAWCLRLGLADAFEPVSTMDCRALAEVVRRRGAAGLIAPGTDGPVRVAAEVAADLGLPHPLDPTVARIATDKALQRAALAAAGVPQPRFGSSADGLGEGPLVVKAADGQGQRGLTLVRDRAELGAALAHARAAAPGGAALVEEYVAGPEVTVNAFTVDGSWRAVATTDRERARAFGVATAHVHPPGRDPTVAERIAERACAAVGIRQGPSYTQLVLGPQGPCVMEVAARLGGGHDAELCAAATGVDLAELAVRAALGRPVGVGELVAGAARGAIVRFLLAPAGTLRAVEGLEQARAIPGVLAADAYRAPGDVIAELAVGADRAGFVLAAGRTRADAEAAAAVAAGHVRFVV
jgi:biotin carboxylase